MTEPDVEDEDPFSSTNPEYRAFLSLKATPPAPSCSLERSTPAQEGEKEAEDSVSQTINKAVDLVHSNTPLLSNTQASMTQVDVDEEDPFPTLPPVPSAPMTAFKPSPTLISTFNKQYTTQDPEHSESLPISAINCSPQTPRDQSQQEDLSRLGTPSRSPTRDYRREHLSSSAKIGVSQLSNSSSLGQMPNIGSFGDASEIFELSPRFVRAAVHGALRGKFRGNGEDENNAKDNEDEDSSIPQEVRDFLGIFGSQSQSQTQDNIGVGGSCYDS